MFGLIYIFQYRETKSSQVVCLDVENKNVYTGTFLVKTNAVYVI